LCDSSIYILQRVKGISYTPHSDNIRILII